MMKWIKRIIFVVLFALSGYALYGWAGSVADEQQKDDQTMENRKGETAMVPEVPAHDMLLVQVDAQEGTRRILECDGEQCSSIQAPASASGDALSDGKSWYYYTDDHTLVRKMNGAGEAVVIVEATPLVRPRDIFISPDGFKVAYWLDNTDSKKALTELWVYDSVQGGTRLVAENIVQKDVVTRVRWNRAGTNLWFLSQRKDGTVDFAVADVRSGTTSARFSNVVWSELEDIVDRGVMDVSADGATVAFAENNSGFESFIVIVRDEETARRVKAPGGVAYIQWLEADKLLYAVQGQSEFSFWTMQAGKQAPIARFDGVLRSALGDSEGRYMAFVGRSGVGASRMYVLDTESKSVRDQGAVQEFGTLLYLVHSGKESLSSGGVIAGAATSISDEQLTAFIQKKLPDIIGATTASAVRIIVSDAPGIAYVDYRFPGGNLERILVEVRDVVHPEWEILGKYQSVAGEWQKIEGGAMADPAPLRLYEWEDSVQQWILKK